MIANKKLNKKEKKYNFVTQGVVLFGFMVHLSL